MSSCRVRATVWLYTGKAAWHFIRIPEIQSKQIKKLWKEAYGNRRKGFGSVPVSVTLGKTVWRTSIFPEKGGTYLLPLKTQVRKSEQVVEGDTIQVVLELL